MTYVSEVLADSPAMYLRLGETAGTNANDETANNNDGTYTNPSGYTLNQPSLLTSDANPSVKLISANSGYAWAADAATLDLGNTFTMEAWVTLNALGSGADLTIMSKQNGAYCVRVSSDVVQLLRSQTAIIRHANAALASTGPHHIVATKAGATSILYLNGAVQPSFLDGDSTCVDNGNRLHIGADGSGNAANAFFNGLIDEVAVYPTALSAVRIQAHYDAGVAQPAVSSRNVAGWITRSGGR